MYQPLLIFDLIEGLGFGQQIVVAAGLVLFVLYLFRARKYGGLITGLLSTAWLLAVSIAVVFVLVIAFGWADPNPAKFASDIIDAGQATARVVMGPVDDWVKSILDNVTF